MIFRSETEIEFMRNAGLLPSIKPYWDPQLKHNRNLRLSFFTRMAEIGLVSFSTGIRARVAPFFVGKKDGHWLRLVIDGREPSSLHHRPPHVDLGSPAALAELDFSDDKFHSVNIDPTLVDLHGASADLQDGFYQFSIPEIASWFAIDKLIPAGDFSGPFCL